MPTALKYIASYFLWVGFDVWFGYQTYLTIQGEVAAVYTDNELFWHYILWMIAPVIPIILFHILRSRSEQRRKLLALMVAFLPVMLALPLLHAIDPDIMQRSLLYFIPPFSTVSVCAIFAYSFVMIGLSHLDANALDPDRDDIAHTAFKLLAFFGGIAILVFVLPFGMVEVSDDSFGAMKIYIVALTIPIYIAVAAVYVQQRYQKQIKTNWFRNEY